MSDAQTPTHTHTRGSAGMEYTVMKVLIVSHQSSCEANYVLSSVCLSVCLAVCLCVINFCRQDISKYVLWILAKLLPWKGSTSGADHIQDSW